MRIAEDTCGDVRILRLAGDFDAADIPAVTARIDAAPGRVFVNLRDVTFASASALGCLVEARARLRRRKADLVISAPSDAVARVMRTLGLEGAFPRDAFHDHACGGVAHGPLAAAS
jgi:anti-anti-sigma factor